MPWHMVSILVLALILVAVEEVLAERDKMRFVRFWKSQRRETYRMNAKDGQEDFTHLDTTNPITGGYGSAEAGPHHKTMDANEQGDTSAETGHHMAAMPEEAFSLLGGDDVNVEAATSMRRHSPFFGEPPPMLLKEALDFEYVSKGGSEKLSSLMESLKHEGRRDFHYAGPDGKNINEYGFRILLFFYTDASKVGQALWPTMNEEFTKRLFEEQNRLSIILEGMPQRILTIRMASDPEDHYDQNKAWDTYGDYNVIDQTLYEKVAAVFGEKNDLDKDYRGKDWFPKLLTALQNKFPSNTFEHIDGFATQLAVDGYRVEDSYCIRDFTEIKDAGKVTPNRPPTFVHVESNGGGGGSGSSGATIPMWVETGEAEVDAAQVNHARVRVSIDEHGDVRRG